jgi:hypothetical protein
MMNKFKEKDKGVKVSQEKMENIELNQMVFIKKDNSTDGSVVSVRRIIVVKKK